MKEWTNERVSEWVGGWVGRWVSEWLGELAREDGQTDGRREGRSEWVADWLTDWLTELVGAWVNELINQLISETYHGINHANSLQVICTILLLNDTNGTNCKVRFFGSKDVSPAFLHSGQFRSVPVHSCSGGCLYCRREVHSRHDSPDVELGEKRESLREAAVWTHQVSPPGLVYWTGTRTNDRMNKRTHEWTRTHERTEYLIWVTFYIQVK